MSYQNKTRQQLQLLRDEALDAYLNREDFQYNLNADSLYQQYKDRYLELGRNAMEDTMGQTAALTGGYGSSYAQRAGQQAYQGYLQQLNDVVPELYQLAYDRYRDRSNQLYQTYQNWAALEQQAAQEEAARQQETQPKTDLSDSQYYALLSSYQGAGQRAPYSDPTDITTYDNQNISTGNIMRMQTAIGRKPTGMWTKEDQKAAGKMTADQAWDAYCKGQLQNRQTLNLGDTNISKEKIKILESILGRPQDGIWDTKDKQAAGGLSAFTAYDAYTKGKLQYRKPK